VRGLVNSRISPAMRVDQIDDKAVRELVERALADRRIEGIEQPWEARGRCVVVADYLAQLAREAGFAAWRPSAYRCRARLDGWGYWSAESEVEVTPEAFGYTDRLNRGYPSHYWACIERAGRIWGVDLTASQYGYSGPLVRVCEAADPELWAQQRIWAPQLPAPLDYEDIAANRIKAGVNAYAQNPGMVQLWQHPDGLMRYARSYAMDEFNVRTWLAPDPDLLLDAA
jgi:hypothetical protein